MAEHQSSLGNRTLSPIARHQTRWLTVIARHGANGKGFRIVCKVETDAIYGSFGSHDSNGTLNFAAADRRVT